MGEALWTIMPFLDRWDLTELAAKDVITQQGIETRLLLIDNGGSRETRRKAEEYAQGSAFLWSHNPPMLSLAATWNRALDAVWGAGGERAWVCNNDLRLAPNTAAALLGQFLNWAPAPFFVSAVGVTEEQFDPQRLHIADDIYTGQGGPDFSCFIITRECHQKYRFDENFIPAYCEDLDYHRRLMLGGDGRRIFSVNVPFLHVDRGSGTLKGMDPERRRRKEEQIERGSRAYYQRKWGGPVNQETFEHPFGPTPAGPCALTTPELQAETWK